MAQISQILCSIGWTRMVTDKVNDNKFRINDKKLELTTTWTTKTTWPLATMSPLDVVYVVYVVVKLGVRRTKENLCNLCNLCDNKYPADWITYLVYVSGERWLQTPRKVVPFWQKGGTFLTSHPLNSLHFYSSWVQGVTVEIHKSHAYRVYARYAWESPAFRCTPCTPFLLLFAVMPGRCFLGSLSIWSIMVLFLRHKNTESG